MKKIVRNVRKKLKIEGKVVSQFSTINLEPPIRLTSYSILLSVFFFPLNVLIIIQRVWDRHGILFFSVATNIHTHTYIYKYKHKRVDNLQ